jgi:hypothetical protein
MTRYDREPIVGEYTPLNRDGNGKTPTFEEIVANTEYVQSELDRKAKTNNCRTSYRKSEKSYTSIGDKRDGVTAYGV